MTVTQDAMMVDQCEDRSPSPPPTYDSNGKRTNARVDRMKKQLGSERDFVIKNLIKLNPMFRPPGWLDPDLRTKVYVPVKVRT